MTCTTIFETKYFDLYTDKNGKFWLRDKKDEVNLAVRAKTEIEAYRKAIDLLIFSNQLVKKERQKLREDSEKIRAVFVDIFGEDQD